MGRSVVGFRFVYFLSFVSSFRRWPVSGWEDDQFRFNAGHGLVQLFSSILYVGRPGLHASLARREGCALANTHLFGLVWVMGMAWRGIPRLIIRKIPLNNYLEMIPYDFGATIARIWKSNLHTYTFSMLLCFSRGGENFS